MNKPQPTNPYSTYKVTFPYKCSFSIADDGHETKITIETKSEVIRYGRSKSDIELQMHLDRNDSRPIYAKHILNWINNRLYKISPTDVAIDYGDDQVIELATPEDVEEFKNSCLNDE